MIDDLRRPTRATRRWKAAGWHTAALLCACALATGCAQQTPSAPAGATMLTVTDAWAPATPPNVALGAAYLQIDAPATDTLLGAETPAARAVEIHQTVHEDGMMKMRQLESLPIAAGTTRLEPHGTHLMLIDLVEPLAAGETFPLTLRFAEAGEIPTGVTVMAPDSVDETSHQHH